MANQLHYSIDHAPQENIATQFLFLPTDQICLIDDCFDDAIAQKIDQTTANDVV